MIKIRNCDKNLNMNKNDIINIISQKTNFSNCQISLIFENFKELIIDALKKGEIINLKGFGKFYTKEVTEKFYVNPLTKTKMFSTNKIKPKFKFSSKIQF